MSTRANSSLIAGGLQAVVLTDPVPRPAPKSVFATVVGHWPECGNYRRVRLRVPEIARDVLPGQAVMITVPTARDEPPVLLPRPMAIHRLVDRQQIDIVYAVIGRGTRALARVSVGARIRVTGPFGNGFTAIDPSEPMLLLGRGVGVCSLMTLAQAGIAARADVDFVLSARNPQLVIGQDDCADLGVSCLTVFDSDGSSEVDVLSQTLRERCASRPPAAIAVCGSRRLAALGVALGVDLGVNVYISLEAHMACGLGYCHGCSISRASDTVEAPLACLDGPVFQIHSASSDA